MTHVWTHVWYWRARLCERKGQRLAARGSYLARVLHAPFVRRTDAIYGNSFYAVLGQPCPDTAS